MTRSEITSLMMSTCSAAGLLLLAFAVTTSAAEAKKFRPKLSTPVKDCTRINGRWGYYGNPWCSKAEQLRWDRWDATRAARGAN